VQAEGATWLQRSTVKYHASSTEEKRKTASCPARPHTVPPKDEMLQNLIRTQILSACTRRFLTGSSAVLFQSSMALGNCSFRLTSIAEQEYGMLVDPVS
jgi:hypothetical protein